MQKRGHHEGGQAGRQDRIAPVPRRAETFDVQDLCALAQDLDSKPTYNGKLAMDTLLIAYNALHVSDELTPLSLMETLYQTQKRSRYGSEPEVEIITGIIPSVKVWFSEYVSVRDALTILHKDSPASEYPMETICARSGISQARFSLLLRRFRLKPEDIFCGPAVSQTMRKEIPKAPPKVLPKVGPKVQLDVQRQEEWNTIITEGLERLCAKMGDAFLEKPDPIIAGTLHAFLLKEAGTDPVRLAKVPLPSAILKFWNPALRKDF